MAVKQHQGLRSNDLKRRGRPTQVNARDIPAEVISVARELFTIYGFESVSISSIATRVGVSPTTVTHHFPDKVELWKAVHEATSKTIWPHLWQLFGDRSLREIILTFATRSIELRVEYPFYTEFLFRATQESAVHPNLSVTLMNRRDNRRKFFYALAHHGMSRNEFREGTTLDQATALIKFVMAGFIDEAYAIPADGPVLLEDLERVIELTFADPTPKQRRNPSQ
jgi:AcrR family transcriptional regulator